jgi:hypothetical protein
MIRSMEDTEKSIERLENLERRRLLEIISKRGVYALTRSELERLQSMIELKCYGENKKANRSKKRLLKEINIAIYEISDEAQHL